jgi:nitrate reductase gamma subunit
MNMRDLPNYLVFGVYPYVSLTVFLLGSWLRFAGEQHFSWSDSGPFLRRQQLSWGATLFHGGILILFLSHFFGLLTPIRVFDAAGMSHSFKQGIAIVVGGTAGVAGLIGITTLLHRRLFDARIRASSSFGDIAILGLIGVQLVLGLGTIVVAFIEHINGCAVLNFMAWAQNILTFRPAAAVAQVASAPLIFKLHMINGMTIFLVLPFTRLVNIWSVPIGYLGRCGGALRARPDAAG